MNNQFEYSVYWKQISDITFKYGSRIKFLDTATVFENPLMPSGTVIHEWLMSTNYQAQRVIPTLPILKRDTVYYFVFDYEVRPADSVYFKINFYRKDFTHIHTMLVFGKSKEILVPADAYSYNIQLMNAASHQLIFRRILIAELSDDSQRAENIFDSAKRMQLIKNIMLEKKSEWLNDESTDQ